MGGGGGGYLVYLLRKKPVVFRSNYLKKSVSFHKNSEYYHSNTGLKWGTTEPSMYYDIFS